MAVQYSFEHSRSRSYGADIRWRMVYQRLMGGLTYERIAANLNVDPSTVWRTIRRFEEEGTVKAKKHEGADSTLTVYDELLIIQSVLETPSIYLHELQSHVEETTGTNISESAICRFLHRQNFSRKKLTKIASQRSDELREKFMIDCSAYEPEMLLFIDETGCDRRSAMRRFGYSLRGSFTCNMYAQSGGGGGGELLPSWE